MVLELGAQRITAHRRPNWRWLVLPFVALLVAGVLIAPMFLLFALIVSPIELVLAAGFAAGRPLRLTGELRISASKLYLDDIPLLDRSQMVDGFVERRVDGKWRVEITSRSQWRRIIFLVPSRRRALAVLSALHLGPMQSVGEYQLSWHLLRSPIVAVATAVLPLVLGLTLIPLFGVSGMLSGLAVVTLYAVAIGSLRALAPKIAVGPDGVVISRLRSSRFIPFTEVRRIKRWPHRDQARSEGLDLELLSGEVVPLFTANINESGQLLSRDPVYARFRKLLRRQRDVHAVAARLAPHRQQSIAKWVMRLRRLGAGAEAGPRVASISSDELVRLLENPTVTPVDRAAAAVALGSSERAPEVRARIEVLSTTVLSPSLREVFETVAEDPEDDERLVEALTPLCAAHEPHPS